MTLTIIFVVFVEDNVTMSSIPYFENRVSCFCAKPKEVDRIDFTFCMTNKCLDGTHIYMWHFMIPQKCEISKSCCVLVTIV